MKECIMKWGSMKKVNVTCRLAGEAVAFLDTLGAQVDRDRSYLINEAVSQYIDVRRWQIEEIHKAVGEADVGDFASGEAVDALSSELAR